MYDVEFDRALIEQSIAKQYGVLPSAQGELKYSDWAAMVSGMMEDTPLGRVVQLRMETDKDALRGMTKHQKQLRAEWVQFKQSRAIIPKRTAADYAELEQMMASLFGKGGV